jgi:3-hydroxyacyl-[acyl-carrier-protein] dehydratase
MIMNEIWHIISHKRDTSNPEVYAEAFAETGSPWFSGHFPNNPILPGIAILSMVTEAITKHESEEGRKIRIMGIRRIRFRLPVRPDDVLTISLSSLNRDDCLSYHFNVTLEGKTACTGVIAAEVIY